MAMMDMLMMFLPYIIVGVLLFLAWRWFKAKMARAGKAIGKGAKVVGKGIAKGGKFVGKGVVSGAKGVAKGVAPVTKVVGNVSSKDDQMRQAAMKGDKKAMAKYGATMLIPGVAQVRAGKAAVNLIKKKKF